MRVFTKFDRQPLLFEDPVRIISCSEPLSFAKCLGEMEEAQREGYYLAGFLSYEGGYSFEEKLTEAKSYDFPLLHFGVYREPTRRDIIVKNSGSSGLKELRLNISQGEYFKDINTIRDYIRQGEVYQITYCIKMLFGFTGDPLALYARLFAEQPVPYPAFIDADDFKILSLSPEMFVQRTGDHLVTKPMKGTWPRGKDPVTDFIARWRFQFDEKNRAENVMIADLLRNDLGRVSSGIGAPKLFEVARYRTLFQMTSTVVGHAGKGVSFKELLASIFPSGSVTGAPKMRAMEIIRELEGEDRRIYTGAIGYIAPNNDLFFNVPIRTLLIRNGQGEMGIGGGIVWDSTPQGEWDEGMLKSQFLVNLGRNNR